MSPQAPSVTGDVVFNPPPGWAVPPGFDPRRGHLVDPTWPQAPADWPFWVARPVPAGLQAALRRGWWGPALAAVVAVAVGLLVAFAGTPSPSEGVGSCWASAGTNRFDPVDCSSSRAAYKVTTVVSNPSQCRGAVAYLEDEQVDVECLEAVSRT